MTGTRWRGWVLVAVQFALLLVVGLTPNGHLWPRPHLLRVAGSGLCILGLVTIVGAAVSLGTAASVHPEPARRAVLRTGGPYRYVRHPIYTGVLVLAAGLTVRSAQPVAAVAFAALVAVLTVKARFEERLLADRFPDYSAYATRTGRFLPRLRRHGR